MANFFRTFILLFSEMTAPLTFLLMDSGPGTRRLAWSVDCETSFHMIKTRLLQRPYCGTLIQHCEQQCMLMQGQNTVVAVLLQWQPSESHSQPVMSRKISGVQYPYDARNVEVLAAQMALTTWHTILMGVPFEYILTMIV